LQLTEQALHQLEEELRQLTRERGELREQLNIVTHQKNTFAEEILCQRNDLANQEDTIVRLAKEKEELFRVKEELSVQITACERENRQQGEVSRLNLFKDSKKGTGNIGVNVSKILEEGPIALPFPSPDM